VAEHHAEEAMLAQIKATNTWAYYQAKGTQLEVLEAKIAVIAALGKTPDSRDEEKRGHHQAKQAQLKGEAEELQEESQHHLRSHGPLSRGVTMFQVAIAVAAISALTRRKGYWWLAIGFGLVGLGFLTWGVFMP